MPKTYQISEEQVIELEAARKANKDKNVERRLKALMLRAQGIKRAEVASQTGFSTSYVSEITAKYCNQGLQSIVENHCGGNHRNLSFAEEEALLEPFKKLAKLGQIVEVSEILEAYETKLGRPAGSNSQIYYVLERHGWRKVMPRSKHPNKASDEDIESSKKLT